MLPNIPFHTVTYDCYVQFDELHRGSFLYDQVRACPVGYQPLDAKMIRWASRYLQSPTSRFDFRLFVLGHGEIVADRVDMVPIYTATYSRNRKQHDSTATQAADSEDDSHVARVKSRIARLVKRTIDEDFARCLLNNGCSRCTQQVRRE